LKFVANNKFTGFIVYRVILGVLLLVLALTGLMAA
jgi:undecaprenyl-diphosphatase